MDFDNEKLITYLKDKWKGRRCPVCQQGNWIVSKELFELREFQGGGPRSRRYPNSCSSSNHMRQLRKYHLGKCN